MIIKFIIFVEKNMIIQNSKVISLIIMYGKIIILHPFIYSLKYATKYTPTCYVTILINITLANISTIVVIHCLAGKGRTGTIICCYLLYSGMFDTVEDAMNYYGK
jgi:protein tyrosine phosphatase